MSESSSVIKNKWNITLFINSEFVDTVARPVIEARCSNWEWHDLTVEVTLVNNETGKEYNVEIGGMWMEVVYDLDTEEPRIVVYTIFDDTDEFDSIMAEFEDFKVCINGVSVTSDDPETLESACELASSEKDIMESAQESIVITGSKYLPRPIALSIVNNISKFCKLV